MQIIHSDHFHDNIVMNRNHQENRGFTDYQECHIRDSLKQYDTNLDVMINRRTGRVRVIDDTYHCIMEVNFFDVHHGLVEKIKRIDSRNGYRAIKEIEKSEIKMKMDQEKKTEDLAYNMAKDMRRPLIESTMYGR